MCALAGTSNYLLSVSLVLMLLYVSAIRTYTGSVLVSFTRRQTQRCSVRAYVRVISRTNSCCFLPVHGLVSFRQTYCSRCSVRVLTRTTVIVVASYCTRPSFFQPGTYRAGVPLYYCQKRSTFFFEPQANTPPCPPLHCHHHHHHQ